MPTKTDSKGLRLYETTVLRPWEVELHGGSKFSFCCLISKSQSLHPTGLEAVWVLVWGSALFQVKKNILHFSRRLNKGENVVPLQPTGSQLFVLYLCKNNNKYSQAMNPNCVKCPNYMVANWVKQRHIIYWKVFVFNIWFRFSLLLSHPTILCITGYIPILSSLGLFDLVSNLASIVTFLSGERKYIYCLVPSCTLFICLRYF